MYNDRPLPNHYPITTQRHNRSNTRLIACELTSATTCHKRATPLITGITQSKHKYATIPQEAIERAEQIDEAQNRHFRANIFGNSQNKLVPIGALTPARERRNFCWDHLCIPYILVWMAKVFIKGIVFGLDNTLTGMGLINEMKDMEGFQTDTGEINHELIQNCFSLWALHLWRGFLGAVVKTIPDNTLRHYSSGLCQYHSSMARSLSWSTTQHFGLGWDFSGFY